MKKIAFLLILVIPLTLQAKYSFDETLFIPIEQNDTWEKTKESATEDGRAITRFAHKTQTGVPELLTIQFRDRQLIEGKTAQEAMANEQKMSTVAEWKLIRNYPNDVIYERSFPKGEHELVRMIMTDKGLHRAAYLKQGAFAESERSAWIERMTKGVIGK